MDAVYVVKNREKNEELRYSIRSLTNLSYRKLVIVGFCPSWLKPDLYIKTIQNQDKYTNAGNNLDIACRHPEISSDFILMNDDFFIMKPTQVPSFQRGTLDESIELYKDIDSKYAKSMRRTKDILKILGTDNPINYDMHTPMLINKQKKLAISELQRVYNPKRESVHIRSLYGNYWNVEAVKKKDPKIYGDKKFSYNSTFLSTDDESFKGTVGDFIKKRFPTPSQHEKAAQNRHKEVQQAALNAYLTRNKKLSSIKTR